MLPVETLEALFPSSGVVGKIVLRPVTVAHAALLDTVGVDITAPVWSENVLIAAWVLTLPPDEVASKMRDGLMSSAFKTWCEKYNPDMMALVEAVNRQFHAAICTYTEPVGDGGETTVYAKPKGFGWPLELAEFLAHEYGFSFNDALAVPLCRVYALMSCARQRNNGKTAVDYYDRIEMAKAAELFRKMKQEREKKESEAQDG